MRFGFTSVLVSALVAASTVYGVSCEDGSKNIIQKSDLQAFINNLNSGTNPIDGNQNPMDLRSIATLFSTSEANFREPSFSVHLQNNFIFASTHVSFASLAGGVQDIMNQCCGNFPTCIGGSTQVSGDTGLAIDVIIKNLLES